MGVKVGTSCLHWTKPSAPHTPQTLASTISLKRCSFSDGALVSKHFRKPNPIRRSCTASSDSSFPDEEFAKQLRELAARFQITPSQLESCDSDSAGKDACGNHELFGRLEQPDWLLEPPITDMIPAGIERKASSVELPLSLRMIKRKRQKGGCRAADESACCSVNKAFSSMVFIIRELQCFAIQAREAILCEDLQGILSRVHKEMHASFVWLFQQVFSRTPTLMFYVMILLANYSVHSMTAFAAPIPTETVSILEYKNDNNFGRSSVRTFSARSNFGKTESVGGGSGGSFRPVSSGTDGGGKFRSEPSIFPDGVREERERESVSVSGQEMREEEARMWDSIVDEAMRMQSEMRDEALDHETLRRFVSPVLAKVESDDYTNYFRTELFYQMGLAQDPINPLLLANYAQFLYLVARDYNRAEEYFKRAVKVKPSDAEALSKYASFLWQAKMDLWGAEENYLDAISADPTNSYYAANYAHFLWSTGGEDTCFPIDALDINNDDA